MCVQCMMGAMSAGAAVIGTRSWLASKRWAWLSPERLQRVTIALVVVGLVSSATMLSGSS